MNQYTESEIITNLNNLEVIIHQIVDDYPELKLMRTTNGDAPATWEKWRTPTGVRIGE
jgi:hypothetical protein